MADHHHEHGSMDITEQQKTFAGFITFTIRLTIFCIAVLIFLAIFRT